MRPPYENGDQTPWTLHRQPVKGDRPALTWRNSDLCGAQPIVYYREKAGYIKHNPGPNRCLPRKARGDPVRRPEGRDLAPYTTQYAEMYCLRGGSIDAPEAADISPEQCRQVMAYVRSLLLRAADCGEQQPQWPLGELPPFPVHVGFRIQGAYGGEGIALGGDLRENLTRAALRAVELRRAVFGSRGPGDVRFSSALGEFPLGAAAEAGKSSRLFPRGFADQLGVDVTLFHGPRVLDRRDATWLWAQITRGVHGLALQAAGRVSLLPNSKWLIHNYSHTTMLERLSESLCLGPEAYRDPENDLVRLDTVHIVQPGPDAPCRRLYRGDRTIGVEDVTPERVRALLDGMGRWLLNSLRSDGRLEYKYMPSRGSYSTANNMVRQWMATHAFAELFEATGEADYADAWRRNVSYNLRHFYVEEKDYGYILYKGKAKLGAAACALMALLRGPDSAGHAEIISRLKGLIFHLSQPDGGFRTFLVPSERNDNQNFYPGEALLALALCLETEWDDATCDRVRRGMEYYMRHHRATGRNAAFVPWHTAAYWHMYRLTGDEAYRESIFELNDWLICIQDLGPGSAPDMIGRFYVEEFAWNGPPHASSTAVYVEGLTHAYDLARGAADRPRAEAYLNSIRYGLRSLMQLQYRPENAFYLRHKNRSVGGLRTTVTDNQLRCDSTQHAVMAAIAALRFLDEGELSDPCPGAAAYREKCLARFRPLARPR